MYSLIGKIYGGIINRRNKKFDAGKGVEHVNVPVISVGNITLGGTGKTPMVQLLAKELQQMGRNVGIVSRGYRRRSRGVVEVSDGNHVLVDVEQSGDELQLLACSLPHVVCIAAENRFHGATRIVRKFGVDCILLDDGFQHRQLHRDVDIVLVDRTTLDYPTVMPTGRLREPLESLQRANIVVCMNNVATSEVVTWCNDTTEIIHASTVRKGYTQMDMLHVAERPVRAVAVCAIAQPERFLDSLRDDGVDVVTSKEYRDHHAYFESDIAEVVALCKQHSVHTIVTTQKDAVKLARYESYCNDNGITICALEIATNVGDGITTLQSVLQSCLQSYNHENSSQ